jgi:hypothetical protein
VTVGELYLLLGVQLSPSWRSALGAVGALKVALEGVASVITGAADIGTHLALTSQQTGLAVSSVQEFGYIAERTGVNARSLTMGVGMLERQLHQIEEGGGKRAAKALAELGISTADVADAMKRPGGAADMLLEIGDKLAAMPNTAERAAIMMELFGRYSSGVAVALAKGSPALREMIQHFKDLGAEISDDQVSALQNLKGRIVDLHVSWEAFKTKAVAALAPLLDRLITAFTDLAHVVGDAMVRASEALQAHWATLIAVVAGLAAAFIALRAEALLTGLISLAPFVLLGVLIGALILIVNDLWVGFHGGRSVLLDLADAFVEWVKVAHPTVYSVIEAVEKLGQTIATIAEKLGLVTREFKALRAAMSDDNSPVLSKRRIENLETQQNEAGQKFANLQADLATAQSDPTRAYMIPALQQAIATQATRLSQIKTQLDAEKVHANKIDDDYGDPDNHNRYSFEPVVAPKVDTTPWANAGASPMAAGPSVHIENLHVTADTEKDAKAITDALGAKLLDIAGALGNGIPSGKVRR